MAALKPALDDSAWQARKSSRRLLAPFDAVRETSSLSRQQWRLMKKSPSHNVDLEQLIQVFNQKKIPFVLIGAHAVGTWTGRPRGTRDVDLLVRMGRNHARAVKVVRDLYPHLESHAFHGVTTFVAPGEQESLIDIVYPHRPDLADALAHAVWIEKKGLKFRIPALETALANKYGAMLNTRRALDKRLQDTVDFMQMVKHSMDPGCRPIDVARLEQLGEMVWAKGGGKELCRLVSEIKAGKMLDLNALFGAE